MNESPGASTTSLAVLLLDQSNAPSCAVEEHRELGRLIETGDGDAATALMARRLGHNQLDVLALNSDSDVRQAAAENSMTPPEALAALAFDLDSDVHWLP